MGLEQEPDGTWVFTNPAQTFIDPATFSTPDPDFPTAPVDDDDDEQDTTCEEGYIYDETLKKCVPETPTYEQVYQGYTGTGEKDEPSFTPGREIKTTLSADDPWKAMGDGKGYLTKSMENVNELFPYDTYNKTRAQYNEHMLILEGLEKGYIMYDYDSGSYIQMPFAGKDKLAREAMGAGAWKMMEYFNEKSYKDYFEILRDGWQPASNQNSWKTLIQGNAKYSLTGGMLSRNDETGEMMVQFSKDFQAKINKALKLRQQGTDAIIDRDGNVNINAGDGGYYTEDGKFVAANGQVQAGGSLSNGIQYLLSLEKSGLKLPENLKARLIKGINTQALSNSQKLALANSLGYTGRNAWVELKRKVDSALSDTDSWSMADVVTEVTKDVKDVTSVDDGGITTLDLGGTAGTEIIETTPGGGEFGGAPTEPSGPDEIFEHPEPTEPSGPDEVFEHPSKPYKPTPGTEIAEDKPGGGEFSYSPPKKDKYERPGTSGAPGHHW